MREVVELRQKVIDLERQHQAVRMSYFDSEILRR